MPQHQRLIRLALLATIFGIGHHVDHMIRGNHVGWPVVPELTPFTYSLAFYPVIAYGLYLYLRGRTAPGFWALLSAAGFFVVGLLHFGPFAVEPVADIIGPYSSKLAGYAAVGWLVTFLALLAATSVYAYHVWRYDRRRRPWGG